MSRFTSRLKGWKRSPPTTSHCGVESKTSQEAGGNDYNDRQRAQIKYVEAATQLKTAIRIRKGSWDSFNFDFEELSGEPEGFDDSQFKNKINEVCKSRETSIKDRKGWSKFAYAIECVFTAFSPFAKNFLIIANNAQSVLPLIPVCHSNLRADTCVEPVRFNLWWSLSLNNGILIRKFQFF